MTVLQLSFILMSLVLGIFVFTKFKVRIDEEKYEWLYTIVGVGTMIIPIVLVVLLVKIIESFAPF